MPEWNWRWSGLPLDLGYQKYIAISTLIGLLLSGFAGNPWKAALSKVVLFLAAYLALVWLSTMQSVDEQSSAVYFDVIWKSILMALVSAKLVDTPRRD